MNGSELLRVVDAIHRDKNIDKEIVFEGIEQAILSAARKHFGEESEVAVDINRDSGEPTVKVDGDDLEPNEIGDLLGRIAAQTAKQVMIQKIREAERDSLYEEFDALRGQIVTGTVSRVDGGSANVNLGKVEGLLPRSERIPGEDHRVGERVRSVVMDVRKVGSRVRIILSRTHPELVRRLFELEIPEVAEHIIEIRSLAREAGYRSKVAVSCIDSKIDCVGACVGVRGSRIRSVVDELAGERIDIVRWNDSLHVLVPNALQPAEVEQVILCPMLGKVIVLVRDEQLSLAIGKKGQNVRLASKLVGWDIYVMTQEKLDAQLDSSLKAFAEVSGVNEELAENLVMQGFFSFDDLSVIEPDQLAELGGLTSEECDAIVAYADTESDRLEEEKRRAYQKSMAAPAESAATKAVAEKAAVAEGEAVEGEAVEGEAVEGEAVEGEAVEGEAVGEEEAHSVDSKDLQADDEGAEEAVEEKPSEQELAKETNPDDDESLDALPVEEESATTDASENVQTDTQHSEAEDESETGDESVEVRENVAGDSKDETLSTAETSATDE